jgi:hypothetical protein
MLPALPELSSCLPLPGRGEWVHTSLPQGGVRREGTAAFPTAEVAAPDRDHLAVRHHL